MKKMKFMKILIWIIVIGLLIAIVANLFPVMKDLGTTQGQIAFKEKVESSGIWGILSLFALQFAQIFLVILPGEPLEILAGMCYGAWGGMLYIFVTVFLITSLIVFLVRKFGKKFIYHFFSEERVDKIENSKFFKNSKKIEMLMVVLFLIPGTPKDLLVYIGGLLPIKPLRFILISTFARFPSVISSTMAGANLSTGDWKMSILVYGITFAITAVFIWLVHKFDKDNVTEEAMRSLK